MQKKRYPGVRPFETADKDLFFGRERDVQDLSVLITLEKLVVLFAKSGYGKSSLVNAGIIPHLTKSEDLDMPIVPIIVRLGSYSGEETSTTPVQKVLAGLYSDLYKTNSESNIEIDISQKPDYKISDSKFLEKLITDESLWYHFKRQQTRGDLRYLLIFDQFEEFFTYPIVQQESLKSQLAELLYIDMPQLVREAAQNLENAKRRFLSKSLDVKVLFAIRADRMSQLDNLKDKLPAILHKRYELKGLSKVQAQEAIEKPAQKQGDYHTSPFTYSPQALRLILEKLGESKQNVQNTGIEAFQLQILCEYLEGEVVAGRIFQNRIEPEHFADKIEAIYEGYYQRLLDKLPEEVSKAAQRLIEESLIFSDDKTGESRRLSVDSDALVQRHSHLGITHETLRALENAFLLRREANSIGGFSYEVSHDTLVKPIVNARELRLTEEARIENENREAVERLEAERIVKETAEINRFKEEAKLKQQAEDKAREEEERRKKAQTLALMAILGFILSIVSTFWAFEKSKQAQKASIEFSLQRDQAIKSDSIAHLNLEIAQKEEERAKLLFSIVNIQKKETEKERKIAIYERGKAEKALNSYIVAEKQRLLALSRSDSLLSIATNEKNRADAAIEDITFFGSLGLIHKNGKFGFINRSLQEVIPLQYDAATNFDNLGYAEVEKNGIKYLIDTFGFSYNLTTDISLLNEYTQAVDLRSKSLTTISEKIFNYPQIEILLLSDNMIATIPSNISNLKNLKTLDLSNNRLNSIPIEISFLTQLEHLELDYNRIGTLPIEITNLSNLIHFSISYNSLSLMPNKFEKLRNLKILYIQGNPMPWDNGYLFDLRALMPWCEINPK